MLRGAIEPPAIIYGRARPSAWPRRRAAARRARSAASPPPTQLRLALDPLVKVDDGLAPKPVLDSLPYLSFEARAEAAQRVAFIYYVLGRDADVRRVADQGRAGATGEWAAQAAWVSGLAAWRMGDFAAPRPRSREAMRLAASRIRACAIIGRARRPGRRRPRDVQPLLLAAARSGESFYGLLARETLGMDHHPARAAPLDRAARSTRSANVRRATELVAIGERSLAEEMLRHQAKIGSPADQEDLIAVARSLDLGGAQFWLAHNGQPGTRGRRRRPLPGAATGPRARLADRSGAGLCPHHPGINFRTEAVSPAGAVGLMQVRPAPPATRRAPRRPAFSANLKDPETNLDYGQAFIELIRGSATRGQLPKVIAAYNAGPVPVERWAYQRQGRSLAVDREHPYWETRYYVPAVLRNMWVYQGLAGAPQPTLRALAEHRWPTFPTTTTARALEANRQLRVAYLDGR
jgi:soluble lytic murein transglycosylase